MANNPREDELRRQFEHNQIQFVLTELDTAATFCEVAKSSDNREKIQRNTANAREGYDTAMRFARTAHFDAASKSEFDTKLGLLQPMLRELGEEV